MRGGRQLSLPQQRLVTRLAPADDVAQLLDVLVELVHLLGVPPLR